MPIMIHGDGVSCDDILRTDLPRSVHDIRNNTLKSRFRFADTHNIGPAFWTAIDLMVVSIGAGTIGIGDREGKMQAKFFLITDQNIGLMASWDSQEYAHRSGNVFMFGWGSSLRPTDEHVREIRLFYDRMMMCGGIVRFDGKKSRSPAEFHVLAIPAFRTEQDLSVFEGMYACD